MKVKKEKIKLEKCKFSVNKIDLNVRIITVNEHIYEFYGKNKGPSIDCRFTETVGYCGTLSLTLKI